MKRQKSISSQAESISAWKTVFDCPSMVEALSVSRQLVVSRSAALRNTAARSSQAQLAHSARASRAAAMAAVTSSGRAVVEVGQHVAVVVRHHRSAEVAGADVLAADDQRDLDPLAGHRGQPRLDRGALRAMPGA